MNCIVKQADSKRGEDDPINALLNFGYTIVTRELEGLIKGAGLDPAIGFYHRPDNDRPSLACDWVEEFRHPLVDRLVLKLVNNGMVKAEDFEDRVEKGGLRLKPDGLRKFLKGFEKDSRNKLPFGPESSRASASSISYKMSYVTLDIRPCPFIEFNGILHQNWWL